LGWATYAAISGLVGLVIGSVIAFVLHEIIGLKGAH
jgi:hypothetical protein